MANPRLGGAGIGLSVSSGLVPFPATPPIVASGLTNAITLLPAAIFNIPAGTYFTVPGPVTSLQWLDPVSTQWRTINAQPGIFPHFIDSDGGNWRLANLTGTPVGALITNAGTGYTNGIGTAVTGLTITASAGASTWVPVVGGSINSAITITTAGTLYLFAPILVIDAPPPGGIQATATCTISAGAINAVTVTNQGAGYTVAPTVTIVNDPRDTTGSGGVLTVNATLAGSGTLTAMYPSAPGTVLTAVPTFTFAPASTTAATAIMNFTVTAYALATAGSGGAGHVGTPQIISTGLIVAGTRAANTAGPINDTQLTFPRPARISTVLSAGAIIATGQVVEDPGFGIQVAPTAIVQESPNSTLTAAATLTLTVGGTTDTSWLQRI